MAERTGMKWQAESMPVVLLSNGLCASNTVYRGMANNKQYL